jgi:hypothetical protein
MSNSLYGCFFQFISTDSISLYLLAVRSVVDLTPSSELLSLARSGKVLFGSDVPNVAVDLPTQLSAVSAWCGDDAVARRNVLGDAAELLINDANEGFQAWLLTMKGNL